MVEVTENEARQRQTAAYARHIAWLRHTQPELPDEEMDRQALQKVDESVYGVDAKRDRHGNFILQGIGSPGHETINHFTSLRKYEGEESYRRAVAEIWKRDPDHAKKLGLPQPART
jgi:hypothetical protein